ncbi:MAG TPA: DNA replication/repair protein RecF [Chloroflexota bacterium]|jgi:DNA replication and repair protein RecF
MQCTHLSLVNFRNYVRLEIDLDGEANVVVGANAQGKSNLLEAIYCLATTKSFRAGSDRELISWQASGTELSYARLGARVVRRSGPIRLDVVVGETTRRGPGGPAAMVSKRFKVNGVPKRAFDVIGLVNVVHFAPEDVDLVVGPPAGRRRYLDITIAQIDSRYVRALARYGKLLLQRNHLLRRIRDRQARGDQLGFWDEELVSAGAYVVMRRHETVARLATLGHDVHRDLAGGRELLRIGYRSTLEAPPDADGVDARLAAIGEAFRRAIAETREREVQLGASLVGPHRDDLTFEIDGRDVAAYGSRGQQRTVALALKMAEGAFIREATGEWPVLLLDDVMSELDEVRRGQVLSAVAPEQQVIMTATELEAVDAGFLRRAKVFEVEAGAIAERLRVVEARASA